MTMMTAATTPSANKHRILKSGDTVRILDSGTTARAVLYHQRNGKYQVVTKENDAPQFFHRNELQHIIAVAPKHRLHVLVPCHLEKERDLTLLLRSLQSLLRQVDPDFTVCISCSCSTSTLVDKARDAVQVLVQQPVATEWYLQFVDSLHRYSEFQHLQKAFCISSMVDSNNEERHILFLKQKDLFHPQRIHAFRKVLLEQSSTSMLQKGDPFLLRNKLMLDETRLNTSQGRLQDFIVSDSDFDGWRSNPILKRKVKLLDYHLKEEGDQEKNNNSATTNPEDEEEEYIDYCVPTTLVQQFFEMTPIGILCNPNCDVRFCALLSDLAPMRLVERPNVWLLIQYPKTQERYNIESTYTRQDWISGTRILEDPRLQSTMPLTDFDRHVVEKQGYSQLSPLQVAILRHYFEARIVQYAVWNEDELEDQRIQTCRESDLYHGRGLGKLVWKHCETKVVSCFNEEETRLNQTWSGSDVTQDDLVATTSTSSAVWLVDMVQQFWLLLFQWIRLQLSPGR